MPAPSDCARPRIRIGTAGWSIPAAVRPAFPATGHGLERYAARFDAVEVNSTFYRPHRPQTYARWRDVTPDDFRFALKIPRAATHEAKLVDCGPVLDRFFTEIAALGDKAGPLLVQLPPSLPFDPSVAGGFFDDLRRRWTGAVACEPRHATWFSDAAEALMVHGEIARVAADPPRHPRDGAPGGWSGLAYWRLHGSPRIYWSAYDEGQLQALAKRLALGQARQAWCVFDNTAAGSAADDALSLIERLNQTGWSPGRSASTMPNPPSPNRAAARRRS